MSPTPFIDSPLTVTSRASGMQKRVQAFASCFVERVGCRSNHRLDGFLFAPANRTVGIARRAGHGYFPSIQRPNAALSGRVRAARAPGPLHRNSWAVTISTRGRCKRNSSSGWTSRTSRQTSRLPHCCFGASRTCRAESRRESQSAYLVGGHGRHANLQAGGCTVSDHGTLVRILCRPLRISKMN